MVAEKPSADEPFDMSRPGPSSSTTRQERTDSSGRMRNLSESSEDNSDLEVIEVVQVRSPFIESVRFYFSSEIKSNFLIFNCRMKHDRICNSDKKTFLISLGY